MSPDYDSEVVILTIKYQKETFQIDLPEASTVSDLRSKLEVYTGLCSSEMRLIHKDEDDQILVVKLSQASGVTTSQAAMPPQTSPSFLKMMSSMLKAPGIKEVLSNPEQLKTIFGRPEDPNLQSVFEKNPELQHIMNDPSIMKEAVDAMQNPSLRLEMMRNQDLALSNIEMHPKGFNSLRRTYATIQKPLLDAVDESARVKFNDSEPQIEEHEKEKKVNREPLPNPWKSSGPTVARKPISVPNSKQGSPKERFRTQLKELEDMGFTDEQENVQALVDCNGDIDLAVDRILSLRTEK